MLTEQFVAAISASTKPNTGLTKDAGIFVHEYQPLAAQRHIFKKSATAPNGIAVSSSHIFAAQADKAIVHVYSREKGNQEAIVPFPERIHSIALAAQDTVLLLGTESGRILAWEVSQVLLKKTSQSYLMHMSDLLRSPCLHVHRASPTRDKPSRRSLLHFLPIRLSRCHDTCLGTALDPLLFARYLPFTRPYPLDSPRAHFIHRLRTQLKQR